MISFDRDDNNSYLREKIKCDMFSSCGFSVREETIIIGIIIGRPTSLAAMKIQSKRWRRDGVTIEDLMNLLDASMYR